MSESDWIMKWGYCTAVVDITEPKQLSTLRTTGAVVIWRIEIPNGIRAQLQLKFSELCRVVAAGAHCKYSVPFGPPKLGPDGKWR